MEEPTYKPDNAPIPEVPKHKLKKGTIVPDVDDVTCKSEAKRSWAWVSTYSIVLVIMGLLIYLINLHIFPIQKNIEVWVEKLLRAAMFSLTILAVSRLIDALVISKLEHDYIRYNLRRVLKLLTFILVVISIISILFVNWYAAAVSLGLISLILGFALQTPITSFIGWIYILIKRPYVLGDRVQIDDFKGDVVDIGYMDTTLWEFGGKYLSTDHPSGRLIKFPNSMVLNAPVFNFTWSYFPYIWNEVSMFISYMSDLNQVAGIMKDVTVKQLGDKMADRIHVYKDLLKDSPINTIEVNDEPVVFFRTHENTWVEAIVRYVVDPRKAGTVKSILVKEILQALNSDDVVAVLPNSNAR
jgi:small-conductance mechanosensitive channel